MRSSLRFAQLPAVLALVAVTAFSQQLPQGVRKVTSVEGITEYALPNGLRVLLFPDESKPKVTVNMTYLVGSRFEGYGETGMAHLLEHMLFKETKTGRDVKKELSDHGADFNGTTSYDRTNYYETVQANDANLRWALQLEAERMTGMKMEKALLDTEMTVVRNEFEMGENDPSRILEQRVLEAAYTFHSYGRSTIGSRSDIEHVPMERLDAFYHKYYQPDNALLTVAGKFDEPKTLALIAEMFTRLPRPARKLDRSFIEAEVRLRQDQSADEAKQILLKTLEGFAAEPPSKEEVQRAKDHIIKNIELGLTNSEMVGLTLSESAAVGDWRLLFLSRDEIKKVTEQDVLRVAKAYLKESNRTLGQFIPTKSPDRAEIPASPDPSARLKDYKGGEAVSQGEQFDPTPANIESRVIRAKLPSGAKVVFLPKKTRGGTVTAQMIFRFGDEKTLFGKATVGQLAGSMLMRGTKNKSRQQIQDEADRIKTRINVGGNANSASAGFETTEANLAAALKLAAEVLREPAFPENELETIRGQRVAGLEAGKSDPQNLAFLELNRHLSSEYKRGDVRYVATPDEQIEDLKKVTIADVRDFYKQFYGGSTGEIVITGQFNKDEAQKLLDQLFGDWKNAAPYARILGPYRKVAPADRKIETPDKQN